MRGTKQYHLLLKKLRIQSGLTQAQLAQKIHESQSYVSKYESGEQRLDLNEIHKICSFLEIDLLEFIRKYLEA